MVKNNKNLKKKQAEEAALKQKLLDSMKLEIQEEEQSEDDPQDSDEELEEGSDVEAGEEDDDEDDDEEGEDNEAYEESDEDEGVAALDKSVYEDSDDEDDDDEEADDDDEEDEPEPVKPTKSKGPAAKKPKLEKVESPEESEDDDDEEVTEEPIKRHADVENKALKRKLERAQKKNKTAEIVEKETSFEKLKVEELPLTCFIQSVPFNLGKNGIIKALKPFTEFQRVFFQANRGINQNCTFYVVFENKEQMDKAIETEIILKNPRNPDLTGKKIKLVPTKWTIFNSLSGHCVCVKGLTPKITENDLKKTFGKFGEVLKVELVTLAKGVNLKFPFAYIFFKQVESAAKSVEAGSLEVSNVKVDVHAYQKNVKESSDDKKSTDKTVKLEKQGDPITLEECSRTLHIANAHPFTTHKEIEDLLSKFGKVNRVLSQLQTSQNKSVGKFFKVVFESSEDYENAVGAQKLVLGKKTLHKSPIKWNTLSELQSLMVKVEKSGADIEKEEIEKCFKSIGEIANIEILKPKKRDTNLAFVFFKSQNAAKKAVTLNGTKLEGKTLSVHQRSTEGKKDADRVFLRKPDSKEITKEALEKVIKKYGQIKSIYDGKKNFVVTFNRGIDATKALNLGEIRVDGVSLKITGHQLEKKSTNAVIVTGFSKETTIEQVLKHFKKCGKIVNHYIGSSKRPSGARTNFACLTFGNQDEKTKALKLAKTSLNGKLIFVGNSKPKA